MRCERTRWREEGGDNRTEFTAAVRRHLRRAEVIVYSSLLIGGGAQIVIRERFPQMHPPWPLIGGALVVVLLAVVLVPPLLLLVRLRKNPDSDDRDQPPLPPRCTARQRGVPAGFQRLRARHGRRQTQAKSRL